METNTIASKVATVAQTPVSLETVEKRVRRALAPRCCSLLKTRPGTPDRESLGLYAVMDHNRVVIERNANLESLGVCRTFEV